MLQCVRTSLLIPSCLDELLSFPVLLQQNPADTFVSLLPAERFLVLADRWAFLSSYCSSYWMVIFYIETLRLTHWGMWGFGESYMCLFRASGNITYKELFYWDQPTRSRNRGTRGTNLRNWTMTWGHSDTFCRLAAIWLWSWNIVAVVFVSVRLHTAPNTVKWLKRFLVYWTEIWAKLSDTSWSQK